MDFLVLLASIINMFFETYTILVPIIFPFTVLAFSLLLLRSSKRYKNIVNDKKRLTYILDSLPAGIITFEAKSSDYSLNMSATKILQVDCHDVKSVVNKSTGKENEMFWNLLSSDEMVQNVKLTYKSSDGSYRVLLASQSPMNKYDDHLMGRIFHFIDVTEEEERNKRMWETEKEAVLGGVVARAAHEIRNPLTVISGFLSVLEQKSEAKEWQVSLMLKELDRMNAIVNDMLLLAKPGAPLLKEAYIEDILNEILPLYNQSQDTKNIHFHVKLQPEPLLLDSRQITQVLYNLIRNSCEAMGEFGEILIESSIKDDKYCLFIKDTGSGIPIEIQEKLFEPFVTCKETGTGLGLTIVQQIIESHGGTIELYSNTEAGVTFLIVLPLN